MGAAAGESALALDGVTKRYGDFTAVDRLGFRVPRGVVFGLLGPNGSGKTTTLRMINDIIAPDEGTIRLFDALAPGRAAARRIGYLPEERGLYPKMRVLDMLQFFAELRGLGRREGRRRASAWLERLGIAEWEGNKVQDLSKGMQQKVQFASALIHEPELVILDEPWSGLDPINAEVLRDVVLDLRAREKTVIFSTHLMEQAEKICDHVVIIARGTKMLDGPLEHIKREAGGDRTALVGFTGAGDRERGTELVAASELVEMHRPRGELLEVELHEGGDAGALLAALVRAEIGVRRFELVEPTLHQIFVDRVGGAAASPEEEAVA